MLQQTQVAASFRTTRGSSLRSRLRPSVPAPDLPRSSPVVGPRVQPACPQPAPPATAIVAEHAGEVPTADAALPPSPGSAPTRPGRCVRSPSARTWPRWTPTRCACWPDACPAHPSRCAPPWSWATGWSPSADRGSSTRRMFDLGATGVYGRPVLRAVPVAPTVHLARRSERRDRRGRRPVAGVADRPAPEHVRRVGPAGQGSPARRVAPAVPSARREVPGTCACRATRRRTQRVAAALVDEGFARWSTESSGTAEPVLRLR